MEFIRVENLSVEIEGREVFKGVSLSVKEGEKLFITGDNGCGKSSLIETIMGFLKPKEGKLFFKGKELKEEEDFKELRSKVGYVFQNPDDQLFCPTVEEEIAFAPLVRGKSREETERIVKDILKEFEIEHLRERPTHKLSGGEKRIVSIGAVLSMEPEGLILDEPTVGLDRKRFKKLVNFLQKSSKTIVVITHEKELIEELNWRVFKMGENSP
ncbi:energy-coupling factor ABC transporter ATP-binding protein [Thermovibrio sp.]